ncbi:MAG: hypothetical protein AB1633_03625 [Elusimicrobiota bacterium]
MIANIVDTMSLFIVFHAVIISKKTREAHPSHGLTPGGFSRNAKN